MGKGFEIGADGQWLGVYSDTVREVLDRGIRVRGIGSVFRHEAGNDWVFGIPVEFVPRILTGRSGELLLFLIISCLIIHFTVRMLPYSMATYHDASSISPISMSWIRYHDAATACQD